MRDALAFFADLPLSRHASASSREPRAQGDPRAAAASSTTSALGYLTLRSRRGTLSGGEAQRIRLATQIGSALVGVLYVLDEPSHRPAPARQPRGCIDTLKRLRDLGNTVLVVEHDEETIRAADHVVDIGPGRRRARRPRGRRRARPTRSWPTPSSLTGAVPRRASARSPCPRRRRKPRGGCSRPRARASTTSRTSTSRFPLGVFTCVTGVSRLGQEHAGQRHPLQGAGQTPAPRRQAAPGAHDAHRRARAARQGHRHRPVADRPHAALQPGHLHRRLHAHPRAVRAAARGARRAATSPAASASTSRAAAARPARATA